MERPDVTDAAIVRAAETAWAEGPGRNHEDFFDGDEPDIPFLASLLADAVLRTGDAHDTDALSTDLAHRMSCPVDETIRNACESFAASLHDVHAQTVRKWASAWGPAAPFKDAARVEIATGFRKSSRATGIAVSDPRYADMAQFLFSDDEGRKAHTDARGHIGPWRIVPYEDCLSNAAPDEADRLALEAHRAAQAETEAASAAAGRRLAARSLFSRMTADAKPGPHADAAKVYAELAGTPEEAARIVAALTSAAVAALEEREEPSAGTPEGRLL